MNSKKTRSVRTKHTMVEKIYKGEAVEIDAGLAPLIEEIWKAGISTYMSCQEVSEGIAWIEFDTVQDLLKFLNIATVFEPENNSIYNRAQYLNTDGIILPIWEFRLNLLDIEELTPNRQPGDIVSFHASVGAYFPHADIPALLENLEEFNSLREADCTE